MNDIEQRYIKMFCTIFVVLLTTVVFLTALGSFSLSFQ
jgi:hypothetical protein